MITRRRFITTTVGMGLAMGHQMLPSFSKEARAAAATLRFTGWDYAPDWVQQDVNRFQEQNPDIKVDWFPSSGKYHEKVVAMLTSRTPLDVLWNRDDYLAEFVEAGWIQPIDGFPRVEEYKRDLYDHVLDAFTYKGKLYGLPYYTDIQVWAYNADILKRAGIEKVPATWDEVTDVALRIKSKGIVQYPVFPGFKQREAGFNHWYAMIFASEARLFNASLDPIFDQPGHPAHQLLTWLVDGIHKHQIIDRRTIETDDDTTPRLIGAGECAFTSILRMFLLLANDPKRSKYAGQVKVSLFPSLKPGQKGTYSQSRMYSMTSYTQQKDAAWRLIEYMGGKDKTGTHARAKWWYLNSGNPSGYKSVAQDKEIQESTKRMGDPAILSEQEKYARTRENLKTPWFTEWHMFNQAELQRALMGQIPPAEALKNSANFARKVKREWK